MTALRYRLLNVFTVPGDRLSGNPLCVFEDGSTLDAAQMQRLARQFNLSETTFILPAKEKESTALVRIFTPTFEMPFAGHPTLGTAHVVRSLQPDPARQTRIVLEMKAGLVNVTRSEADDRWTLQTAHGPKTRPPKASSSELAAMLGLQKSSIRRDPFWIDTGAEQLVIPLATADDVRRAKPSFELLGKHGFSEKRGASMAYVWAPHDHATGEGRDILARFFFLSNDSVIEDPATGSACANLGGYLLTMSGSSTSGTWRIHQGEAIGRPSILSLTLDRGSIFVGGQVVELGAGTLKL